MRIVYPILLFIAIPFFLRAQKAVDISGKIENAKTGKVYIRYVKTIVYPYDYFVADSSSLNAKGEFTMKFRWNNPWPAEFVYAKKTYDLFLVPGDSLYIKLNTERSVSFLGNSAKLSDYLVKAKKKYAYSRVGKNKRGRYRGMETDRFISYIDSVRNVRLAFYNSYFKTYQPPQAFADYILSEINYEWAHDHFFYVWSKYFAEIKANEKTVDKSFYSFLNRVSLNNENAVASPYYYKFLGSYLNHLLTDYFVHPFIKEKPKEDYHLKKYRIAKEKLSGTPRKVMLAIIIDKAIDLSASPNVVPEILNDYKQYNSEYYNQLNRKYQKMLSKPVKPDAKSSFPLPYVPR